MSPEAAVPARTTLPLPPFLSAGGVGDARTREPVLREGNGTARHGSARQARKWGAEPSRALSPGTSLAAQGPRRPAFQRTLPVGPRFVLVAGRPVPLASTLGPRQLGWLVVE